MKICPAISEERLTKNLRRKKTKKRRQSLTWPLTLRGQNRYDTFIFFLWECFLFTQPVTWTHQGIHPNGHKLPGMSFDTCMFVLTVKTVTWVNTVWSLNWSATVLYYLKSTKSHRCHKTNHCNGKDHSKHNRQPLKKLQWNWQDEEKIKRKL